MRAIDKKFVRESFRNLDPRYRCVTNVGRRDNQTLDPKSHVKVPDFLKNHLSVSNSGKSTSHYRYATVTTSLDLNYQPQISLLSSRTNLSKKKAPVTVDQDKAGASDAKIHVHDWA